VLLNPWSSCVGVDVDAARTGEHDDTARSLEPINITVV
jgi:hypothetical protein